MRLGNVWYQGQPRVAVMMGDSDSGGCQLLPKEYSATDDLWEHLMDDAGRERLMRAASDSVTVRDLGWRPPVLAPSKVLCIGLNYRQHARETGADIPTVPVVFNKFPSTLAADGEDIPIPAATRELDYEAELVIVMGRRAFRVSPEESLNYVAGYAVGNDVSARDLQRSTSQWLFGKSSPGFAPLGPWITTADEVPNPQGLPIQLWRNDVLCQNSNTEDMIFSCQTIISHLASVWPLEPGDLIFTGTPEGVILGLPEDKRRWLQNGDVVKVAIAGLGELTNRFVESRDD
ncbi:fumarylacetoacetate hydrolase family protein [Sulfobacillus harzensis]|uniref:Fumarylacetoacetate hydrolase family protein n=1 Tax=Sulfobacillus harzensis TaxID=2729629 RepID=A0A7Y0L3S6_9FIRM|nr:fumarylacetoacetate hydrolase family protein [Sulfobacillus harzensis]NMP21369.1 fumarylacetoacetate hydrolase family protein [Sulfobacillus harzensis]